MITRRAFVWALAGSAMGMSRRGWAGPVTTDEIGDQVQTVPRGHLPDFAAPPDVRAAYRYAVERGADLEHIPCVCGCVRFRHRHNRDCYIKSFNPDGTITFTSHAAT